MFEKVVQAISVLTRVGRTDRAKVEGDWSRVQIGFRTLRIVIEGAFLVFRPCIDGKIDQLDPMNFRLFIACDS